MTAQMHFREGGPKDRDAILRLRSIVFPDEDLEKQSPEFWDWEFASAPGGSGRIFVAEVDGEIVGHFGVVPQQYEAGMALSGGLAVDVMTHPDFRRARVFARLAAFASERLRENLQIAIAFQIRQQVLPGMLTGGWRTGEAVPVVLKPLSWLGIAKDLGLPVRPRTRRAGSRSDPHIRGLTEDDLGALDTLVAVRNPRQPRTPAFLRWRYCSHPAWRYDLRGYFQDDRLRAFIISRETILRGMRTLAILDAGTAASDPAPLSDLLRSVCREASDHGTSLAAALLSAAHPAARVFKRYGFFRGPHRFRLLLQPFDESLGAIQESGWSLTWGDTDHV